VITKRTVWESYSTVNFLTYETHPQEPAQHMHSENLLVEWNKCEGWKGKRLLSLKTLTSQSLEKKKSCLGWKTMLLLENKY